MSVLHASRPYGHRLQCFRTDEVKKQGERYFASHVQYHKDGDKLVEIERHPLGEADGFVALTEAVACAERSRHGYLECEAEEGVGAAEEMQEQERKYHQATADLPGIDPFQETSGCNTRIEYMYRDGANFKARDFIVVAGALNEHEQKELRDSMVSDYFIPEQVGMPPLHGELRAYGPGDDDAWHEIEEISITEDPTTFPGTAQELLAKFKVAYWDPSASHFEDYSPSPGGM